MRLPNSQSAKEVKSYLDIVKISRFVEWFSRDDFINPQLLQTI